MSRPDPGVAGELLRQSLREGKQPHVTVASNSMLPLLRSGDRIQLAGVKVQELRRGDIIVIESPDDLIVHRYWSSQQEAGELFLMTRGDHLLLFDPRYSAKDLVARVTKRQRQDRQLDLTRGTGRWLNRCLANIAALEAYLLEIAPAPRSTESGGGDTAQGTGVPPASLRRSTHKVLHSISTAVTLLVDMLAQTGPGE